MHVGVDLDDRSANDNEERAGGANHLYVEPRKSRGVCGDGWIEIRNPDQIRFDEHRGEFDGTEAVISPRIAT